MSISGLNLGATPVERPDLTELLTLTPVKFGTEEPFLNGGEESLVIEFHDITSVAGKAAVAKLGILYPAIGPEGETWTEEELEKAASNRVHRNIESVARSIKAWNIVAGVGGNQVKCSVENILELFDLYPDIATECALRSLEIVRTAGNVKRPSSSGQPNKAG